MKLKELAKRAASLPDCKTFDWPGPEQYSSHNFKIATATNEELRNYVEMLAKRMQDYSFALVDLAGAYRQLRDIILEAELD